MPLPPIMQAQRKPLLPNVQAQKLMSFSIMHNPKFTLLPIMNKGIENHYANEFKILEHKGIQ
jgi:hypothetical protein